MIMEADVSSQEDSIANITVGDDMILPNLKLSSMGFFRINSIIVESAKRTKVASFLGTYCCI